MNDAAGHLAKARDNIGFARYALAGEYFEEAGRSAYMAAYHAALAFIVGCGGKAPKTHSGVRSEFARLARGEMRIGRAQVALLGWSYELKNAADYGQEHAVSLAVAERAIDEASQLIETIATIVRPTGGGN
ncbi:MAG: HEPN domain-containing protein [Acetobacteraceae bacterium]